MPVGYFEACFPGHEASVKALFAQHAGSVPADTAPALATEDRLRVGRYLLEDTIGRGGQGTVYRAYDPELDRHVAIKVGHVSDKDDLSSGLRLVREARVGARLAHPGICPVLDHGIEGGAPYVVMPYLDGWSLRQLLQFSRGGVSQASSDSAAIAEVCDRIGLPMNGSSGTTHSNGSAERDRLIRVVSFVHKLATAMAFAHAHGVLHRDLKPANILVQRTGEPVILDLGLAKDQSGALPTLTRDHDLVGTPAYVAPEQLRQRGGIGPGVDVWALGVVLTECLTGERPFPGPSREQLYRQILDEPARPMRDSSAPRDLQVLVEVALQKDPERRYATATELADDLDRFVRRLPIQARSPGTLARLGLWTRRRPALAATTLGLFLVLVAALVTLAFLLREREHSARLLHDRHAAMRQVADDIVFDLIERLASTPGTAKVRRKLADRAIEYLEILGRDLPADVAVRRRIIAARVRLGDALGNTKNQNLGLPEPALEQFRRARREITALLGTATGALADELTRMLADCDVRTADVLMALGRFADAREHLRRARAYHESRDEGGAGSFDNTCFLAAVVADLSNCATNLGEPERAKELAQTAIGLADRLVEQAGDDPIAFERAAQRIQVACVLREQMQKPGEALEVLQRMYPRVKELAARNREHVFLQHSAIVFGMHIGRLLLASHRVRKARPVYADVLQRLGEPPKDSSAGPPDPYRDLRLRVHLEYGTGLVINRRWRVALQQLDIAATEGEAALRVAQESRNVRKLLDQVHMQQALAHAGDGHFDVAKQLMAKLMTKARATPENGEWTEDRLRDRLYAVIMQAKVFLLAWDFDSALALVASERRFFGGLELHDSALDGIRRMADRRLKTTQDTIQAFVERR